MINRYIRQPQLFSCFYTDKFFWKQLFIILFLPIFSFAQSVNKKLTDDHQNLERNLWGYAQANKAEQSKLPIDFSAIMNWQEMSEYLAVSNNGAYFAYSIESGTNRVKKNIDSLIVQTTDGSWRHSFAGISPGYFTPDNRQYVFKGNDRICFLQLGMEKPKIIEGIKSSLEDNHYHEWIAYNLKGDEKTIVLKNLLTGEEQKFRNVSSFSFDPSGKWLLCKMANPNKDFLIYHLKTGKEQIFRLVTSYAFSGDGERLLINIGNDLQYLNCTDKTTHTIWSNNDSTKSVTDFSFDGSGEQVLFNIKETKKESQIVSLGYFKEGMSQAKLIVDTSNQIIRSGAQIRTASFTDNSLYIRCGMFQPSAELQSFHGNAQLDVWSYKDVSIQTAQKSQLKEEKKFNAIICIQNGQVKWLDSDDEQLYLIKGDYAIVKKIHNKDKGDRFWTENRLTECTYSLISLNDGTRRSLSIRGDYPFVWFSPGGKYLVYFDPEQACNYFSYELQTGKSTNLSIGITERRLEKSYPYLRTNKNSGQPYGIAAWLESDLGLLVYDKNDIWELDFSGKKRPINLTNTYGRSHSLVFNLMNSQRGSSQCPTLKINEQLLLRAFNINTKDNGFYRIIEGVAANPNLLSMSGNFMQLINTNQDGNLSNKGMQPIKAKDSDIWIVQRQTSTDATNYFSTSDFKSFKRLTNFQPHKNYRWITEELHSFSHLDGNKGQGVLYKPENFDPLKKYPVMIVFYGGFSNSMHQFPTPAFNICAISPGISPAFFTNNGYLVFVPDIYEYPLKIGPGAYSVIDGAAAYLRNLPYVDANGLGCATHSFSSKMGAYLFTHSKSFSAMSLSEGFLYGNIFNIALSSDENGNSRMETIENGFHFGNLYENKAMWVDHTTVLNIDRAKSPLLLFCSKKTDVNYHEQTLQMYNALRRLNKKVWWHEYDKGLHVLHDLASQKDYTIRYTQFFDHYLKKGPAPKWMTQGVPYALRGVEARFELDPSGTCDLPNKKECAICQAWNKQYKRNPAMFAKEIKDWELDKDIKAELDKKQSEDRKRLDKEGAVETKRILDILKNGYAGDNKRKGEVKKRK